MTISTQRLRFLRGNSAAAGAFIGLQGELIFDTTLYTLRLQDGLTPGGYTLATSAQLANVAANANYGNTNVGAYLTSYTGNLSAGNILSNNYLYANGVSILAGIQSNYGNSNVAAYLTVYTGNLSAGNIFSNNYLYPNGVSILTGVQSNYGNANVAAYLVANPQPGTYSNTNVAAYLVANPQSGTYSNTNVAAYLVANPQPGTYSNTNVASYLTSLANVKIGFSAGFTNQGFSAVAIGPVAAATNQGNYSVAIGSGAGQTDQGNNSVAIGTGAAAAFQGLDAVAIGTGAGGSFQGNGSVAIGSGAGGSGGSEIATVAIGDAATVGGNYSIAIGRLARVASASTIMFNATGSVLNSSGAGFYVDPVSSGTSGNVLYYNTSTKQITYGAAPETYGNANVAAYLSTYTGNIAANNINANIGTFNTIYGTIGTASQTGITTLGTLTGLAVSGTISTGTLQVDGNATIGNLLVTGTSTIIGNINMISGNSGQFFGNSPTGFNALYTGIAAGYTPLQQTIIQSSGNYNDYAQINLENVNSGNAATGDYVVTADNGTDSTYYVDMGIASSNFDGLSPNIVGNSVRANDAYLYTLGNGAGNQGGNLIIGAGTSGKIIKLIAGGGNSNNVVATVAAGEFTVVGNITGTYILGNGSQLTGLPATYANSNVASYLPTYTGNISAANISLTNNTSALTFNTGAYIYGDTVSRPGSITLQPNTSVAGFPSVVIGGAGRLAAPNGSVHAIFNTTDLTVQVPLKVTSATAATSTSTGALTVSGGAGVVGNVYAGGAVVATGNVTGNFFIGNGALLTGITASSNYGNTNVAAYLASNSAVPILTTSNVTGNFFVGNGSLLTGIVANTTYSNTNVASYLTGNIVVGNISGNEPNVTLVANTYSYVFSNIGNVSFPGNLSVTSNVSGNYFIGNGALLTGIAASGANYSNANVASYLPTYTGNIAANIVKGTSAWTFDSTGNLTYPDGTKTSGNTVTLANSASYYWKFNEPAGPISDNITLSFNSLTTEQGLWYFGTDNTANTWILNSGTKTINFSNNPGTTLGGRLTFGDAANIGNASANDIELSSVNANAYVRASNSIWKFDVHGNLTVPGRITNGDGATISFGTNNARIDVGGGFTYVDIQEQDLFLISNTTIISSNGNTWDFVANGNLILPSTSSAILYPNGTSILSGITGGSSNYSDANVATFLGSYGSNTIVTTGNISAGYFVGNGALLTGIAATANYNDSNVATFLAALGSNAISTTGNVSSGNLNISGNIVDTGALSILSGSNGNISLIPNGTGIVRAPGQSTAFGNVGTAYPTASNVTTLFIGNNTTITSGGSGNTASYMMNNLYFQANGQLMARNTYASGAGQFSIDGGTFTWNAVNSATVNTAAGLGARMSLSSTTLSTQNSIGITSAGTLTVQGASGIVTSQTTFPLANTVATTINFGGVATAINMGAANTVVTVGSLNGNLVVGNITTNSNITVNNTITTGSLTLAAAGSGNISGVGNLVGITSNTTITAGTYVTSFLSNGAVTTTSNVIVTGSNAISIPNLPAFRVYGTSSAQITANTTISGTQGATIEYNQGSYYNNTTGIFTAPVAGLYHCYATVRVGSNNGLNQASIQRNSSQSGANVIAFWETDTNTGTAMHFAMTGYAKCVVGDTIRLQVISGNINFDSNDSWGVTFIG